MGFHSFGWIILLTLGLILCSIQPGIAANIGDNTKTLVQENNVFAAELYAQLKAEPGNLCFSPYSILTALSMTYAGARNTTEAQMAKVLHFHMEQEQIHQAVGAWIAALSVSSDPPRSYQLYTANALWGQQGYEFLSQFTELLQTHYGATLTTLDFKRDPQQAGKTINAWVRQQTQEKITELIDPKTITTTTTLVLTNAIYFRGQWALPFDPHKTQTAPFTLLTGDKIDVPMMHQMGEVFYFEDHDVQVVELPYGQDGGEMPFSMLFFLPQTPEEFSAFETGFSAEYFEEKFANMQKQKVMVSIPKFIIRSEFSLPVVLTSLGMPDAFSFPPADFSGMTGKKELYISDVVHKVFLEVNEEGSEAAGATGVVMSRGFARHPIFQADHPFLVVIRDNRTGGVVFLGRVMDPRA